MVQRKIIFGQRLMNSFRVVPVVDYTPSGGFPYTLPFPLSGNGAQYNGPHFDDELYYNGILPWQMKVPYAQKWQMKDVISAQFDCDLGTTMEAFIYNCYGNEVAAVGIDASNAFPGNTLNGVQLRTNQWRFSFSELMINTGYYLFVVKVKKGLVEETYVSEPFYNRSHHPGTKIISCNHSENTYDAMFSMRPKFCIRVEAELRLIGWGYTDTSFEDQRREQFLSHSEVNRKFDGVLGTRYHNSQMGVPQWLVEKAVQYHRCDTVLWNGKRMVRQPNTDPEIETFDQLPLVQATFKLLEQNRQSNQIYGAVTAQLFIPDSFPFFLSSLSLGGFTLSQEAIIGSSTEFQDIVDAATNDYVLTGDLTGEFDFQPTTGGYLLTYTNGPDESYLSFGYVAMYKKTAFNIANDGDQLWNGFEFESGTIGIDFGLLGNLNTYSSLGETVTVGKFYPTGTNTLTIGLWHNDDVQVIEFLPNVVNGYSLLPLEDESPWPASLQRLAIRDNTKMNVLDRAKFKNQTITNPFLGTLIVTGSLTGFSDVGSPTLDFFDSPTSLVNINFALNSLDEFQLLDVLKGVSTNTTVLIGSLDLRGQDPIAAPATGSATYIDDLTLVKGWTVLYNP